MENNEIDEIKINYILRIKTLSLSESYQLKMKQ